MTKVEKIKLAAELLNVTVESLSDCCAEISETDAMYFSVPVKGVGALIIGEDGGVLYADSSVSYRRHVDAYLKGVRTPLG